VPALAKNLPLEIQNGLWEDMEFQNFWRQALQKGCIVHAGRTINIPSETQLIRSEGYDWKTLQSSFILRTDVSSEQAKVLNPQLLNEFFNHDIYFQNDTERGMTQKKGLIKAAKGKSLSVILTHPLPSDQWAKVLMECQRYKVSLQVECAPGVTLPKELVSSHMIITPKTTAWKSTESLAATQVITSTDVDTTLAMLIDQNKKKWQIIDVSECTPSDILERLDGSFNASSLRFEFSHKLCALSTALKNNTPIILKGRFSVELEQQLASLLLDRQRKESSTSMSPLILKPRSHCGHSKSWRFQPARKTQRPFTKLELQRSLKH
jgi:hypothetical protein